MSADGSITLPFADGEHRFRLAIGQLRELQEAVNLPRARAGTASVGPAQILAGLGSGEWWVDDLRETIRLGLIGGGATPARALILTTRYVDVRPPRESIPLARGILLAALIGVPEDPAGGKPLAGETATEGTAASSSPASTATAQP
ncbi:gene transfer agent family protein [Methylobacterium dankookense]|uniref:Uncharacterized protein n=1 Tax=Methylobacterium dankookense TaxID=560405 RepID=A0A564G3M9_9HYPH|nr:gene transfer agent family protein [Methylobacterium dankookense]GJD58148.1 hypothetical protein IFDJLNFL_4063 [Methylobacterium dankookense]VUF15099.1 hypothetical protein MTDSW087_04832 [Methylobacterium dankookense]